MITAMWTNFFKQCLECPFIYHTQRQVWAPFTTLPTIPWVHSPHTSRLLDIPKGYTFPFFHSSDPRRTHLMRQKWQGACDLPSIQSSTISPGVWAAGQESNSIQLLQKTQTLSPAFPPLSARSSGEGLDSVNVTQYTDHPFQVHAPAVEPSEAQPPNCLKTKMCSFQPQKLKFQPLRRFQKPNFRRPLNALCFVSLCSLQTYQVSNFKWGGV